MLNSSSIIERTHAFNSLLSLNTMEGYFIAVTLLALVSWRLSKWL